MGKDGHPSPVLFDGDCAAGISHGPMSEVAVEVDGPSHFSSSFCGAADGISFSAAISKVGSGSFVASLPA
eukprot:7440787-Karenia_brevis.AAC.1